MLPRVQSPFREPTSLGFWDRSLLLFKCLCDYVPQSVRQLAHQTGLEPGASSVTSDGASGCPSRVLGVGNKGRPQSRDRPLGLHEPPEK